MLEILPVEMHHHLPENEFAFSSVRCPSLTLNSGVARMRLSNPKSYTRVLMGTCGSGQSPANAAQCFRPRASHVTSVGIARRAGVWSGIRPLAFEYHNPTRPSPQTRFSVATPGSTLA